MCTWRPVDKLDAGRQILDHGELTRVQNADVLFAFERGIPRLPDARQEGH